MHNTIMVISNFQIGNRIFHLDSVTSECDQHIIISFQSLVESGT